MQLFRNERPGVVAGLATALTFGSLALPGVAMAAEPVNLAPDSQAMVEGGQQGLEAPDPEADSSGATTTPQISGQGAQVPEVSSPEVPQTPETLAPPTSGGQALDAAEPAPESQAPGAPAAAPEAAPQAEAAPRDAWSLGEDGSYRYHGPDGAPVQAGWVTTASLPGGGSGPARSYWISGGRLVRSGWVVTSSAPSGRPSALERYWVDPSTMALAGEGLHETGRGSWCYVTGAGHVARGSHRVGGRVYLADNDGNLAGPGWVVSDAYGHGLQRYWVDASSHAAVVGFSTDGWAHYTTDAGYVLRGAGRMPDGSMRYADDDGRLRESGWLVTDRLGQGLQRYWLEGFRVAGEGLHETGRGSWCYVTGAGHVARGSHRVGGRVYLADNDGNLAGPGWVVSDAYGHGLQRYWVDASSHAAVVGFSTDGWAHYTTDAGYVLRGAMPMGGRVYLADNDGRLAGAAGWLVSDAYGQGLQRYWLEEALADASGNRYYAARTGRFSVGSDEYYGLPQGYVLRGRMFVAGEWINADNDGKILRFLNGIDIASYQGALDLSKISADFVFIKATEGSSYVNPTFRKHANQALALGKRFGLYHFVDSRVSPEAQADFFLSQVGDYIGKAALMLDWENNDVTGVNNLAKGPAFAKRFLDRIYQRTGVRPMIYMSRSVVHTYDWSSVAQSGYQLWCAQYLYKYYDTTNGINGFVQNPDRGSYGSHGKNDFGAWGSQPSMYQYTSTGKLDGWNGFLDFNVFYGTGSDWDKLTGSVGKMIGSALASASAMIDPS